MITPSTIERQEFILYNAIGGSASQPIADIKYLDDTGVKVSLEDVVSFSVTKGNRNKQYGKFLVLPPSYTLNVNVDNKGEKYSPGGSLENILALNKKLYASLGYITDTFTDYDADFTLASYLKLYHAKITGGNVYSDVSNNDPTGIKILPGINSGWTLYSDGTYDDGTYSPCGYYESQIWRVNLRYHGAPKTVNLYSSSANLKVYLRSAYNKDDLTNNVPSFVLLGTCSAGSNSFTFPDIGNDRYIQVAIAYYDLTYGASYFNALKLVYNDYSEIFEQGEYLIDKPSFSSGVASYSVTFSARDNLKRALETKISTPDLDTNEVDIAQVIRWIATRAKIPYTSVSIPLTGYTVSSVTGYKNETAVNAFEECLRYLNTFAEYRLWCDVDGNLTLGIKQTTTTSADWVIDYRTSNTGMSKGYTSDALLQRVTVSSESLSTNSETELASDDIVTTLSNVTLSWVNDAVYKRWEISVAGAAEYVSSTTTSMTFLVNAPCTIRVYGCELSSISGVFAESFKGDLFDDGLGMTFEIINRYLTGTEAKDLADKMVANYGSVDFESNVNIPLNPMLELNDRLLILEKNTNTKTIYVVDEISHSFNAQNAQATTSLKLTDIGFDIENLVYDRSEIDSYDDLNYDTGFIYDYDLFPDNDTTDYSYTKEIEFN